MTSADRPEEPAEASGFSQQGRHLLASRLMTAGILASTLFVFQAYLVEALGFDEERLAIVRIGSGIATIALPLVIAGIVDRGSARAVYRYALMAIGIAGLVSFFSPGTSNAAIVLAWLILFSIVSAAGSCIDLTYARLLPEAVPKRSLSWANTLMFSGAALASSVAIWIAGGIVTSGGFSYALALSCLAFPIALFGFGAFEICTRVANRFSPVVANRWSFFEGFKSLISTPAMLALVTYGFVSMLAFTVIDTVLFLLLSSKFEFTVSQIALTYAVRTLALGSGTLLVGYFVSSVPKWWHFVGCALVSGGSALALGLIQPGTASWLLMIVVAAAGMASGVFNVFAVTFRQLALPNEFQARILAASRTVMWSAIPIAGAYVVILSGYVEVSGMIVGVASMQLIFAVVLCWVHVKNDDEERS